MDAEISLVEGVRELGEQISEKGTYTCHLELNPGASQCLFRMPIVLGHTAALHAVLNINVQELGSLWSLTFVNNCGIIQARPH